jgi:hypothetical protein
MIKYIGIGLAGLALVGCTQAAPAPVVTVTAPAPVAPAPPVTPPPIVNEYQDAMEYAWTTLTATEKSEVCYLFNVSPQEAWAAFNSSANDAVPQSEFNAFFSAKCNSY